MAGDYESNIWKFYLFKIVSALELTVAIFILFVLSNGLTMTQAMTLETIFIVIVLLLEVPSGAFADMYGRKISVSLAMLCVSIGFIIFGFGDGYWMFLAAQIIISIGFAFMSGADSALLYDSLKEIGKENQYAKISGRSNSFEMLALGGCALLSAYLASFIGYRILFFITASIFFIGFLIGLLFKEPPIHKKIHDKNFLKHLSGAVKFSYSHRAVRNLIIYYGMFAAFGHLSWFLIQPYYGNSGLPLFFLGIAVSLYFVTAALGNLFAESFAKKVENGGLLLLLLLAASLSFIAIFFVHELLALLFISIMSFACGMRNILVNSGINKHTDSHHRATVVSVQSMSKSLMYAIFAPLIGYYTDTFSASAAFLMMGVGLFIFFLYHLIVVSLSRKEPFF